MSRSGKVQVPWPDIDTLLLDMDGTLLDLAFDNHFWLELVPREYARQAGIGLDAAREEVRARYAPVVGTLPWYCLDHWTREFGLDLEALKRQHRHQIRYLPDAERFLELARRLGKRLILVTLAGVRVAQGEVILGAYDALESVHNLPAVIERFSSKYASGAG